MTPYPDDSVFQEKLEKFIEAFAKEYDNPDIVDFIDGYSLGWWGECHHVVLQDQKKFEQVFDWFTTLYSTHFRRVILALPFGSQIGFNIEKRIAIDGKGYGMRRDGLGSMWFSDEEKKIVTDMYGKTLLIGESCYWGCSSDDCTPFRSDTRYQMNSWRDVYEQTFQHAIEGHFNTLDLRELPETKGWTEKANDLVQKFIVRGGYRIHPCSVSLPVQAKTNSRVNITHEWKNSGNGYLPNNMPNWNYKYKPAFALFDQQGNLVQTWVDGSAEPSDWLHNEKHSYTYLSMKRHLVKEGVLQGCFGDGEGIGRSGSQIQQLAGMIKKVFMPQVVPAALDGFNAYWLSQLYFHMKTKGASTFTAVGHPKAITPYSLQCIDDFLKVLTSDAKVMTISKLLKEIR